MVEANQEKKSEDERGRRKFREGVVVSDKASKTIVVAVERRFKHRQYGKYVSRTNRYMVHDPKEEASEGDIVRITETRPISRTKRWKLASVVSRAE